VHVCVDVSRHLGGDPQRDDVNRHPRLDVYIYVYINMHSYI